jgi:cysteine synthase A
MSTVANPLDLLFHEIFFELRELVDRGRVVVKLEGYNITGSIKIKSALFMIEDFERRGLLEPLRSTIVESSSGNLGVALALICSLRGYNFLCVTDPNISSFNRRGIEAYGGRVVVVDRTDANGGYLESRIAYVRDLVASNPGYVWVNQYANPSNARAHAEWTALEILNEFADVTDLYIGSGTTGTVMGVARTFAMHSPNTTIIAVEPEGSVTFDPNQKGRRRIPGIGTSRRPELADERWLDRIVHVSEIDTIRMCHRLARRHGLLLGGSSGSVLAAVAADAAHFNSDSMIVAVSADLGDKYLETIFSADWVQDNYGLALDEIDQREPRVRCEPLSEVIARHNPSARPVLHTRPSGREISVQLRQRGQVQSSAPQ